MSKRNVTKIDGLEKELLSETERVELFISKYWLKVAIVAVFVVIAGVATYAVVSHHNKKIADIQAKFVSAENDELAEIIAQNSSVPGADMARLRLAFSLKEKKAYADAAVQLQAVADNAGADTILRQAAAMELAAVLELDGKIADAAKAFAKAADETAFSAGIKAQAGCQAARLMIAAKNNADAKAMLQKIIARKSMMVDDFAFITWVSQCEQMLAALDNGDFAPAKAKKSVKKAAKKAVKKAAAEPAEK